MSQNNTNSDLFDVVFFGILLSGKDKETALTNLAKLFKTEPAKLNGLFAGGRKVIKGKVNKETADKYISALTNVGLSVKLEACEDDTAPAPAEQNEPADTAASNETSNASESAQTIETGSLTMAEVGADVLEHPPEKEVQAIDDFSFLTMAEVGADVLEHPVKVKAQVIDDISDIKLEDPS